VNVTAKDKQATAHGVTEALKGSHAQLQNSSFAVLSTVVAHQSVTTLAITLHHNKNWHYFQVAKLTAQANVRGKSLHHRVLNWLQYLPKALMVVALVPFLFTLMLCLLFFLCQ
jgi:hypothetical protein